MERMVFVVLSIQVPMARLDRLVHLARKDHQGDKVYEAHLDLLDHLGS